MIHVCSLARLHATVEGTGARHVVTLLGDEDHVQLPSGVPTENHLWLRMHDISGPIDGYITPAAEHVDQLITFIRSWDRTTPLVVHCYAGISRSTAAAFVSVCALNPRRNERMIATALRRASPTAIPNIRIITLADGLLGRNGRMIAAIETIAPHIAADQAEPFRLDLE